MGHAISSILPRKLVGGCKGEGGGARVRAGGEFRPLNPWDKTLYYIRALPCSLDSALELKLALELC